MIVAERCGDPRGDRAPADRVTLGDRAGALRPGLNDCKCDDGPPLRPGSPPRVATSRSATSPSRGNSFIPPTRHLFECESVHSPARAWAPPYELDPPTRAISNVLLAPLLE